MRKRIVLSQGGQRMQSMRFISEQDEICMQSEIGGLSIVDQQEPPSINATPCHSRTIKLKKSQSIQQDRLVQLHKKQVQYMQGKLKPGRNLLKINS